MTNPQHLQRFPTRAAIDALAERLGLVNEPRIQDWEWEVADPGRIDEFLSTYESGELSEDERFTLMETMLQSFEELPAALEADPRWSRLLDILDRNARLHAHSIWYWSAPDADNLEECWRVTPFLRPILERHRGVFDQNAG
jgi:hypothetical protein